MEIDDSLFEQANVQVASRKYVKVTAATLRIVNYKGKNIYSSRITLRGELGDWLRDRRVNIHIAGDHYQWIRLTPDLHGAIEPYKLKGTDMLSLNRIEFWPQRPLYATCEHTIKNDCLYLKLDDDWQTSAQNVPTDDVLRSLLHHGFFERDRDKENTRKREVYKSKGSVTRIAPPEQPQPEPEPTSAPEPEAKPKPRPKAEKVKRTPKSKVLPRKQDATIPITTICPHPNAAPPKAVKHATFVKPIRGRLLANMDMTHVPDRSAEPPPPPLPAKARADSPVAVSKLQAPSSPAVELPADAPPGSFMFNGKLIKPLSEAEKEARKQKAGGGPTMLTQHQQDLEAEAHGKKANAMRFGDFKRKT